MWEGSKLKYYWSLKVNISLTFHTREPDELRTEEGGKVNKAFSPKEHWGDWDRQHWWTWKAKPSLSSSFNP